MSLQDKVILITGADSGIGRAIALEVARQGANVGVNYHRNQDAANQVVSEIKQQGRQAIALQADVGQVNDIERMVQQTIEQLGRIDVMVNNSGIEESEPFLDKTEAESTA